MKALSKKSLILVLSLVFALSALMFAFSFKSVKAETNTNIGKFEVVQAAQVRTGQNDDKGAGLRFKVKMDYDAAKYVKDNANVELGFLITPKALFDKAVTAAETADIKWIEALENYVGNKGTGIVADENKIYISTEEGENLRVWDGIEEAGANESYYANAAITGIKDANRALPFTMVAYIKTGDSFEYAVPSTDFSRDVHYTVNEAYWAGKTEKSLIDSKFTWLGDAEYPYEISDVNEYKAFATSVSEAVTYENKTVEIVENIDLGSGNGSNVPVISADWAGTLTFAEDVTITYDSEEGYVPLIEYIKNVAETKTATNNYDIFRNNYTCNFDVKRNWTDKVIGVQLLSGGSATHGVPATYELTTYTKEQMSTIITGDSVTIDGDATLTKATWVGVDLGFMLEDSALAKNPNAKLKFKLAYVSVDGSYDSSVTAIAFQEAAKQTPLKGTDVKFEEEGANQWVEYEYALSDVITLQSNVAGAIYDSAPRFEGAPGYIRLFRTATSKAHIYIADVKIETAINLTPNISAAGAATTSSLRRSGLISVAKADEQRSCVIKNATAAPLIEGLLKTIPTKSGSDAFFTCQGNTNVPVISLAYKTYTVSELIEMGYTHLSVSIARLTYLNSVTLSNGSINLFETGSLLINGDNTGVWLNYKVDLTTLADDALASATLLNISKNIDNGEVSKVLLYYVEVI